MKPVKLFNQTLSLMLAALLLVVAGSRSSFDYAGAFQKAAHSKEISKPLATKSQSADSNEAKVSALSLDAVITPAISFDFSNYFYFIPQQVWQIVVQEAVTQFSFQESVFLVSYFHKVFGRFIVTNAP